MAELALPALGRTPAQFLRFLAVGVLNTGFGYAIFIALLWLGVASSPALVLAWVAGVFFNFGTIRTLVFAGERASLVRFCSVYLGVLGLNWALLVLLERLGMPAWAAQGALTLPLAFVSFAAQKHLVFSRP
jgi:putative flippase GtrA